MDDKITILLVDDHALVRGAIAERLNREPDLAVVGSAASADEAICKATEVRVDIILMDIDMPGLNCFEAARRLRTIRPGTRIIFLSAHTQDRYIEQALDVKAHGYLTKREPPERVVSAIREVAAGGAFFSEEVQSRIIVDETGAKLPRSRISRLTPRELEVLQYLARGYGKREIGRIMSLATKTIDNHTTSLMSKLRIHDRVELTRFALREGLAET
jgi:DNA-binding NarL/FixJ family response regulator